MHIANCKSYNRSQYFSDRLLVEADVIEPDVPLPVLDKTIFA